MKDSAAREQDIILVVDDEQSVRETLSVLLKTRLGAKVIVCQGAGEALEAMERMRPAVILSDVFMEEAESGILVLEGARRMWPDVPVILMSAVATREAAIKALNARAFYFLQKPFANEEILTAIREALVASGARKIAGGSRVRAATSRRHNQPGEVKDRQAEMIGESPAWLAAVGLAEAAARTDMTILLEGESGVGKGLLAAHIHAASPREGMPFLSVNCGALTETLLESQLFGHIRGAFTGAEKNAIGMIRAADGGTLFLDEIGETSKATQVRLLHVLQDREVIPVGDTQSYRANVRFVAATNRILRDEVLEGRFREDLFYRLNVIGIRVPPLRERKEDLEALSEYILQNIRDRNPMLKAARLSDSAKEAIRCHDWPGNIREMENALARAAVSAGEIIDILDLPEHVQRAGLLAQSKEKSI